MGVPTYQETILTLERYWADQGCVLLQPYHTEVGAGTFNPATFLRSLGPDPWKTAYVEPSIRPSDGRYGENPYRFQHYFQYQVVLKPAPENVLDLYFDSLRALGIDTAKHDVRLVEDDWEGPTLGAWGLGWEAWIDGMEVTQFTYFQQLGGLELDLIPAEITYGLERLAIFLQGKQSAFELVWAPGVTWGDVYRENERQWSIYNFEEAPVDMLTASLRRARGRVPPPRRTGASDSGLRPGAQVLAHVQPARCARGDLRDGAGRRTSGASALSPAAWRRSTSNSDTRPLSTLLFEIGCEELPAEFCSWAEGELRNRWLPAFGGEGKVLVGPRRLAFLVEGFEPGAGGEEKRGPGLGIAFKDGKPTKAAEGFARGLGLSVDELTVREDYVWGRKSAPPLGDRLWQVVEASRPARPWFGTASSTSAFRGRSVGSAPSSTGRRSTSARRQFPSGGFSYGHRFVEGTVEIPEATAYETVLREARVEPDSAERRRLIVDGLDAIGGWSDPAGVLGGGGVPRREPVVLEGSFDERFLELPERVIVTAMQSHQRYFPLGGARFAFVANGGDPDVVLAGNERVLEGRLEDAPFTFERDVPGGSRPWQRSSARSRSSPGQGASRTRRRGCRTRRCPGRRRGLARGGAPGEGRPGGRARARVPGARGPHRRGVRPPRRAFRRACAAAIEEQYLPDSAGGPLPHTEPDGCSPRPRRSTTSRSRSRSGSARRARATPMGCAGRRSASAGSRSKAELAIDVGGTGRARPRAPDVEQRREVNRRRLRRRRLRVRAPRGPPRRAGRVRARGARARRLTELGAVAELARALAAAASSKLSPCIRGLRPREQPCRQGERRRALRSIPTSSPSERRGGAHRDARRRPAPRIDAAVPSATSPRRSPPPPSSAPRSTGSSTRCWSWPRTSAVRANRLRLLLDVRDAVGALGDLSQIPR